MPEKKIVLEIRFTEEIDPYDDDYVHLEVVEICVDDENTTLSHGEMQNVGESAGQSDFYQIEVNNAIWNAIYSGEPVGL